jgi:hypothetical protein
MISPAQFQVKKNLYILDTLCNSSAISLISLRFISLWQPVKIDGSADKAWFLANIDIANCQC